MSTVSSVAAGAWSGAVREASCKRVLGCRALGFRGLKGLGFRGTETCQLLTVESRLLKWVVILGWYRV